MAMPVTIEELKSLAQDAFNDTTEICKKRFVDVLILYLEGLEDDVFSHRHDRLTGEPYIETDGDNRLKG